MNAFPALRLRRLRRTGALRQMLDMPMPPPQKFIWPVFVMEGTDAREPIDAMPGQSRLTVDTLIEDLAPVVAAGIKGILIFGLPSPDEKDAVGSAAFDPDGIVQRAVRAVRDAYPDLVIFTDVCVCAYTEHGHCGPLDDSGDVANDAANEVLAKAAVSHANAGAHAVAPSAMMDGQVTAIRQALDSSGLDNTIIMSYSTKFASAMYGPFRDAEKSAPQHGDRRGYQASFANPRQAILESILDEQEGADILMVKPSLFYMDMISELRQMTNLPIAAYNVSGEYSMLIATADRGWGDLKGMVRESTIALARAGTDLIISYWANRYEELFAGEF